LRAEGAGGQAFACGKERWGDPPQHVYSAATVPDGWAATGLARSRWVLLESCASRMPAYPKRPTQAEKTTGWCPIRPLHTMLMRG